MENQTKQKIDALYEKIAPLQQEINELIETEELTTQIPRLHKMIGFCLRNSYNNDKSSYARILDLIEDKNGSPWFLLEEISLQAKCNPYIHLNNVAPYTNKEWWDAEVPLSGWDRCSEDEYTEFKDFIFREFQTQKLIRKTMKNYK
jgi:hypothetical protein